MTNLSYKQELIKNYLIKKIGFIEDSFLNKYISFLDMVSPKLKLLGKQKKIWSEDEQKFLPEKKDSYKRYIEKDNYFIPTTFNIIDFLNIELNIKKNKEYTSKEIQLNYISATDISNFTYCPVSFAISKTYELPKFESAILGTLQHEKQTLINYLKPFKLTDYNYTDSKVINTVEVEKKLSFNPLLNNENQLFFEELNKSSIVFYGHDNKESKNKYFKSAKGNFVGQPDYILKNDATNDIFVVEEKFQFLPREYSNFNYHYPSMRDTEEEEIIEVKTKITFFNNHINQLSSYLYGIGEYDIKYGYLVYWKYNLYDGIPNIIACNVLRINKSDKGRLHIRETFIKLKDLITNRGGVFDISTRVPAKCASCVSNLLCGHKTGKFTSFSIPYSKDYLKLYFAKFPEDLKKQIEPNEKDTSQIQTPKNTTL